MHQLHPAPLEKELLGPVVQTVTQLIMDEQQHLDPFSDYKPRKIHFEQIALVTKLCILLIRSIGSLLQLSSNQCSHILKYP